MEKEIKKRKITSIEISYSNKRELKELSNKEEFVILIIGGSQSAKVFGEILPEIIIKCFQKN